MYLSVAARKRSCAVQDEGMESRLGLQRAECCDMNGTPVNMMEQPRIKRGCSVALL